MRLIDPALVLGLVASVVACDLGDGDGDTDTDGNTETVGASTTGFDPSAGPGGEFIPTAGASGATFTAGANSAGNTSPGTSTTTSASATATSTSTSGTPTTCQMPCVGDADCDLGQLCLDTANGSLCIPAACQTCFDQNGSCESNTATCEYLGCEIDTNNTCENPCDTAADCNAGQACLDTATMGRVCLPVECDSCFAAQGLCVWNATSCEYNDCEPQ